MATIYLSSVDGNNADSGATWALAKATLAGAFSAMAAGDTCYVDPAHAETQASAMTLTSPGTAANPCRVICASRAAEPPTALATTATVSTTGASNITIGGYYYYYGITFSAGDAANNAAIILAAAAGFYVFDTCLLKINNTHANGYIYTGAANNQVLTVLNNTPLHFGSTSQTVVVRGPIIWKNTASALPGAVPTTLFNNASSSPGHQINRVIGVDLSAAGAGKNIWGFATGADCHLLMENCKLGASVSLSNYSPVNQAGGSVTAINCDSADTNYRFYRQTYQGTITHEPVIVKTGGSSDGTTPFSRKMVTTANSKIYSPLEGLWTTFWNETVGSAITVAADVVTDGVTLTDAEAWIEAEYLGNGSFPISTTTTDRVSDIIFGTPANQTTSSATWTTTGLASPTKQTLSVSITPQEKGPIRARVCLAKASTTMYVDQVVMSGTSGRQYMIGAEGIINEGASGAFNPLGGMLV